MHRLRSLAFATATAVTVVATVGCPSVITMPPPPGQLPGEEIPPGFERPAPHPRAVRLTLLQWENTVRDLLRLDDVTGFSSELPQDALPAGFLFDNAGTTLGVDPVQWAGFGRAAARTAAFVVEDNARLARILPAAAADETASLDDRARALITALAPRAHRRPTSAADEAAYLALFTAGQNAYDDTTDPFKGGVRLFLEGLLQSPFFLYRFELDTTEASEVLVLDGHALASRLSYALWNTMPDDALFAAAAAGTLDGGATDAYRAEVRRMIDDARAVAQVQHVLEQILEADKLDGLRPSRTNFPDVPLDLGRLAREENRLFLEHVFTSGGGYSDVLTSTETFVNQDLARVYGIDGTFTDEMVPVSLDPATRRGLFTHIGFLAQNATASDPDPIHRGVFLAKNIACLPLSAPPDDIPPLPPAETQETNRQVVERHTEQEGTNCAACHKSIINPFGFAYENYNAIGQLRDNDRGLPIDTATTAFLDTPVHVSSAVELAEAMAASPQVHDCLAGHFIQASLGRPLHGEDFVWTERLAVASLAGESLQDLMVELLSSPGFRLRSKVEFSVGGQQ